MAFIAPRNLKEPLTWKGSALKNVCPPYISSHNREVSTGVR